MWLGLTALWHRLERLGLSLKKTLRAAEQPRPGLQAERVRWWLRPAQWDELLRATALALATFTPEHYANFLRRALYATT